MLEILTVPQTTKPVEAGTDAASKGMQSAEEATDEQKSFEDEFASEDQISDVQNEPDRPVEEQRAKTSDVETAFVDADETLVRGAEADAAEEPVMESSLSVGREEAARVQPDRPSTNQSQRIALPDSKEPVSVTRDAPPRAGENEQLKLARVAEAASSAGRDGFDKNETRADPQPATRVEKVLSKSTAEAIITSRSVSEAAVVTKPARWAAPETVADRSAQSPTTRIDNETGITLAKTLKTEQIIDANGRDRVAVRGEGEFEAAVNQLKSSASPKQAVPQVQMPFPEALAGNVRTTLSSKSDKVDLQPVGAFDLDNLAAWDSKPTGPTTSSAPLAALAKTEMPMMIGRQLAEALQRMPDRPIEVALNPSELGRVRMSISAAEAGITVSVLTERPETLDLMRRNIDELAREFEVLGYETINFAFGEGRPDQRSQDADQQEATVTQVQVEVTASGEEHVPSPSVTSGLDLRL